MEQDHRLEGGQRGGVQLSDGGGVSTGKGAECAFFFCLAVPHAMWDLSFPTRDQIRDSALEVGSLNHWTTREIL